MYSYIKQLVELSDSARRHEIKRYTIDGKVHSVILSRLFMVLSEKGENIAEEEVNGICISQFDKYHQILSSIDRRKDGHHSARVFTYDKKLLVGSISCMIMPSDGDLFFAVKENKYDEEDRLIEQTERSVSRVGGKCFSENRAVYEYSSYGVFEKSWEFSGLINENGGQSVIRQHNIAGERYSGRRYSYEPGKGPIQRFEEFEDEESLGYIVKLKRQPSITFRIHKNSWKMPTVECEKQEVLKKKIAKR